MVYEYPKPKAIRRIKESIAQLIRKAHKRLVGFSKNYWKRRNHPKATYAQEFLTFLEGASLEGVFRANKKRQ